MPYNLSKRRRCYIKQLNTQGPDLFDNLSYITPVYTYITIFTLRRPTISFKRIRNNVVRI